MKQSNEVGIESDRLSVIPVTHISIECICCKQIKIQTLNKYDVPQYYCANNVKFFFFQTANQVGVYILFVIHVTVIPVTHQQ